MAVDTQIINNGPDLQSGTPQVSDGGRDSWIRQGIDRVLGQRSPSRSTEEPRVPEAKPEARQSEAPTAPESPQAQSPTATAQPVSEDEIARRVQAEVDRRENQRRQQETRRLAQEAARAEAEEARWREIEIDRLESEKRKQRGAGDLLAANSIQEDIDALREGGRAKAQQRAQQRSIEQAAHARYDAEVLNPVLDQLKELDEDVYKKLLARPVAPDMDDIQLRKELMRAAVAEIKKAASAQGAERGAEILRDDEGYQKTLLARWRGEDQGEPDHIAGAPGGSRPYASGRELQMAIGNGEISTRAARLIARQNGWKLT